MKKKLYIILLVISSTGFATDEISRLIEQQLLESIQQIIQETTDRNDMTEKMFIEETDLLQNNQASIAFGT